MNLSASSPFKLRGFCVASTRAYAVVVYLKTFNPVTVMLVAAKTRIYPARAVTLPRLELSSAVLLSELILEVQYAFPDTVYETFL